MTETTPPSPSQDTQASQELLRELAALRAEVIMLNRHRILRIENSTWRAMQRAFMRGIAMGLGTAVGATVMVSIMVYFLSQIDFIPIIGDWAAEIAQEIQGDK